MLMQIGHRKMMNYLDPYVIAEVGVNHEGSLSLARQMIDEAAGAGADAVKFQTYKADKLAVRDSPAYWDINKEPTSTQHQLFSRYDRFNYADYVHLAKHCGQAGVDFISSPFDVEAVRIVAELSPAIKIASADITNIPLLRAVGKTHKPVILSTGAATVDEIDVARKILYSAGTPPDKIVLLHCVLRYPTELEEAHLNRIPAMMSRFHNCLVGYSDHTMPDSGALDVAAIMGAVVIEKHFTYDKNRLGNDHYHSMDHDDLHNFKLRLYQYKLLAGSRDINWMGTQEGARLNARRSIVASAPIIAGDLITETNVTTKRPGTGITADQWDVVIGMRAAKNIEPDEIVMRHHLDWGVR